MVEDRLSIDGSEDIADRIVHPRRQYIVQYCENTVNTTISIEELAKGIQNHETGVSQERSPDDRRRLIEIDLHHAHLPKLSAGNVLEYDPQEGIVHWTKDIGNHSKNFFDTNR